MSGLLIILCCFCLLQISIGQTYIKNSGIKTSQSARNQLQRNETYENHVQTEIYNGQYQPAEYYHPSVPLAPAQDHTRFDSYARVKLTEDYVIKSTEPPPLDPVAAFINKTRSQMASGVCYDEVPTSTLVRNKDVEIIGNGTTPNLSRIHVCCHGYQRNPHVYARCEPICDNDCTNGICIAPNKCVCLPGTVVDAEGNCLTMCPVGCANGICAENGDCHCKPGYKLEPVKKQYCVPLCEQNCAHGRCVAPNTCACEKGYRLNAAGTCEPVCDSCEDGVCTGPGVCVCNKGYKNVNGLCEPVCSKGCDNGICILPETCECGNNLIWESNLNKCVPYCDRPCQHGLCTGRNTCTCDLGYVQSSMEWNICNPVCPQGCPQGYCSAPNVCRCNPGFTKSGIKGRTFCMQV